MIEIVVAIYAVVLGFGIWCLYDAVRRWRRTVALKREIAALKKLNAKLDSILAQGEPREP